MVCLNFDLHMRKDYSPRKNRETWWPVCGWTKTIWISERLVSFEPKTKAGWFK